MRQVVTLPIRSDSAGDGHYGAPRGSRTHRGIDFVCTPGSPVLSPVKGTVTKHGCPYGDDLSWQYIQVTDAGGLHHRIFYAKPLIDVGLPVDKDTQIALAQDITQRYPGQGMLPHVHYELMDSQGEYLEPHIN